MNGFLSPCKNEILDVGFQLPKQKVTLVAQSSNYRQNMFLSECQNCDNIRIHSECSTR